MACKCGVLCSCHLLILPHRFRWVYCQLEVLRHSFPSSVRRVLAELPKSLDETYERILEQIPESNRTHAHRLLQCLTVAVRPLRLEELAEVLAVDFPEGVGIPKFNETFRWEGQEQAVLSACSSLITVVKYRHWHPGTVQFSHFSVKEFLTSDRLIASKTDDLRYHHIRFGPAHTIMAQACLSVLLCLTNDMDLQAIRDYRLAEYAGKHFHDHADFEDVLSHIIDGVDDLLDPKKLHFDTWLWLRIGNGNPTRWHNDWDNAHLSRHFSDSRRRSLPVYAPRVAPLYYVAGLGHICLVQRIILTRPQDLHVSDDQGCTPLHIAVLAGQVDVSKLLIENTTDFDALDFEGHNLLHMAACKARFEITRMLLEHDWATKAHINARNKNGQTPLHLASQYGFGPRVECDRPSIVALLLKFGADVNAQDNDNMAPLHSTIEHSTYSDAVLMRMEMEGHGVSSLYLQDGNIPALESRWHPSGVDVSFYHNLWNRRGMNAQEYVTMTPLVCTSEYFKSGSAAQLLLEHGASVHTRNKDGRTPLHLASEHELYDVVALLMTFGADVDAQDNNNMTPLHCAIESSRPLVAAQLLLDHSASIHLRNKKGQTPLHLASRRGLSDVVAFLLKSGADVDLQDNDDKTPLLCASEDSGNVAVPQLLLDHGANVNVRDKNGQTPLHLASRRWLSASQQLSSRQRRRSALRRGLSDVVALLLKSGVDVDPRDNDNKTPLLCALEGNSGDGTVPRLLLEHGASVNVWDKNGQAPLHLASRYDYSDVVALLLKLGADVDAPDNDRITPLLCALKSNYFSSAAQVLLERGASVNVRDKDGQTPLHLASRHDYSDVVALLLKLGADVDALDNDRITPLLCALKFLYIGNAPQVLLEHGASVHVRDKDGQTALHLALRRGFSNMVALLLQSGADIDAQDNDDMTPLLYVVTHPNLAATTQLLLEHGASVHLRNKDGLTPLHFAVGYDRPDEVALLLQFGAPVDALDNYNRTPLHVLAFSRSGTTAPLLLQHGASVHTRSKNGQTPLHFASRYSPPDVVALLLKSGADVDAQDNNSVTPLHFALSSSLQGIFIDDDSRDREELLEENLKTIELLLEHGANVHLQDDHGKTPVQVASAKAKQQTEQLFFRHDQR